MPSTTSAKKPNSPFVNLRGEFVNAKVELINDTKRGLVWQAWAKKHLPLKIFREFKLLDSEGSGEWLNVVEHNVFVAAASLTLARQLQTAGAEVNTAMIVRSAIVHDAAKRFDVEQRTSRNAESYDLTLGRVLLKHGYDLAEIYAAQNTGRLADRYITDPELRRKHIAMKPIEANIIAYCDARTRGSHMYSMTRALKDNLALKQSAADQEFFIYYWAPYYQALEAYLKAYCRTVDPRLITDDVVYKTVSS
jgi:hypothetical protein